MLKRMKEKCKILIFCMIFVETPVFSQENSFKLNAVKDFNNYKRLQTSPLRSRFYTYPIIPANFYVKNLEFFCKQELKLESALKVPFKFRLGSLNYCDWMEGKKNAGILPAH